MSTVVTFTGPHASDFKSRRTNLSARNEVRLQTLYSGISAGTELTAYRGSNPYLRKRWDDERHFFVPAEQPSMTYPVIGWGYEECGKVVEWAARSRK